MFEIIKKSVNEREYELENNSKKINISVSRIKNFKDYKNSLISLSELDNNHGYFIYNERNFFSLGFKNKIDLVWTNWDGKIIHIEENFITNKLSEKINNTKYIYIFKPGTIKNKKIILGDQFTHFFNRKKNKISIFSNYF